MSNIIKINEDHFLFLNHVVSAERAEVDIPLDDDGAQSINDPYGALVTLSNGNELALPESDAEALFNFLNRAELHERQQSDAINKAIASQR